MFLSYFIFNQDQNVNKPYQMQKNIYWGSLFKIIKNTISICFMGKIWMEYNMEFSK
jgi:hypothetical protein